MGAGLEAMSWHLALSVGPQGWMHGVRPMWKELDWKLHPWGLSQFQGLLSLAWIVGLLKHALALGLLQFEVWGKPANWDPWSRPAGGGRLGV